MFGVVFIFAWEGGVLKTELQFPENVESEYLVHNIQARQKVIRTYRS